MKKLFTFLLITSCLITTVSFVSTNINETKIIVVFNRKLDFNDIVKIKLDLSQKGIVLNYKSLEFDENGKLKSIDFNVDCKDGFSGGASKVNLTNQSQFGFYRDYSKEAITPFGAGNLP